MTLTPAHSPEYTYASWWRRLASNCLDSSLLLASIPAFFIGGIFWKLVAVLFVLKVAFYFSKGVTFGRYVTGTRLVDFHTGEEPGIWRIVTRSMAHLFDILSLGIGFLWPLKDDKRQTFADKVMYTVVIRDRKIDPKRATIHTIKFRSSNASGRSSSSIPHAS